MSERINEMTHFFLQLDGLKLVNRKTYINGGERVENSAEHSWQLAIACWSFAEMLNQQNGANYDIDKIIKLALIHDLGEIFAGDTFLYDAVRGTAHIEERKGVESLANHTGNKISELLPLWDEQEYGDSLETKLLKVVDRLLPFLHNIKSEGKSWRNANIHRNQVLEMHSFIQHENPEVYQWFLDKVAFAVENGWLRTD